MSYSFYITQFLKILTKYLILFASHKDKTFLFPYEKWKCNNNNKTMLQNHTMKFTMQLQCNIRINNLGSIMKGRSIRSVHGWSTVIQSITFNPLTVTCTIGGTFNP